MSISIRAAAYEDLPCIEALDSRVQPYRPEDEPAVQRMFARSLQAEQTGDPRWIPLPNGSAPPVPSRTRSFPDMDAFWVAVSKEESGEFAGMVGVQLFRPGEVVGFQHPLVAKWEQPGRVAELRRLRVAPEWRRLGIGQRLCDTVLQWAHDQGVNTLIVNTTTPQLPARQLYAKLGFQEVGISFIGQYELVWMERILGF